jgi:hypothetical protein
MILANTFLGRRQGTPCIRNRGQPGKAWLKTKARSYLQRTFIAETKIRGLWMTINIILHKHMPKFLSLQSRAQLSCRERVACFVNGVPPSSSQRECLAIATFRPLLRPCPSPCRPSTHFQSHQTDPPLVLCTVQTSYGRYLVWKSFPAWLGWLQILSVSN